MLLILLYIKLFLNYTEGYIYYFDFVNDTKKYVQQAFVSRNMLFKKFFFSTLGGTIGAAIVGITMLDKIRIEHIYKMADLLEPWLREIFPQLKIDIPKHLVGRIAEFRQYSCYAIPMAFIKKAIADGDFDANDTTPPMVFVVDDHNNNLR